MFRRLTLCLLLPVLITGCQNFGQPTEADLAAQARNMPTEKDLTARFELVAEMYRDICTAPEYEVYFVKTPCLPTLATKRQLADRTKITPDEARAMRGVMKEVAELNHETRELMRKTGIDIYVQRADRAQSVIDPLILENQEALLARAVTWCEYNQKRSELARLAPDAAGDFEGTDLKLDTH